MASGSLAITFGSEGDACDPGQQAIPYDEPPELENLMKCVDGAFEKPPTERERARRQEEQEEERAIRRIKVQVDECIRSGRGGSPPAIVKGTVRNGSDRSADIAIEVFAEADGLRLGDGSTFVRSLDPGQTAVFEAGILGDTRDATECRARLGNVYLD